MPVYPGVIYGPGKLTAGNVFAKLVSRSPREYTIFDLLHFFGVLFFHHYLFLS